MVLIPAGEFTMGSDKGDDDEQPIHKVFLDSFYLDKFEVTNGRFAKFVEAIQSEPPWGFADKETPVLRPDQPVRWVNWMDAIGYCLWVGKRLPTEAEWEKAARGPDGRAYPWGNDPPTPAHAVFGLKEASDTVSAIGNRDKGKSPYGVHDLAGNLYEWTTDWYDEEFYSKIQRSIRADLRGYGQSAARRVLYQWRLSATLILPYQGRPHRARSERQDFAAPKTCLNCHSRKLNSRCLHPPQAL